MLEIVVVEWRGRIPHWWIVDLVLECSFEGLDYGCGYTLGADPIVGNEFHLFEILLFRLETNGTVEFHGIQVGHDWSVVTDS